MHSLSAGPCQVSRALPPCSCHSFQHTSLCHCPRCTPVRSAPMIGHSFYCPCSLVQACDRTEAQLLHHSNQQGSARKEGGEYFGHGSTVRHSHFSCRDRRQRQGCVSLERFDKTVSQRPYTFLYCKIPHSDFSRSPGKPCRMNLFRRHRGQCDTLTASSKPPHRSDSSHLPGFCLPWSADCKELFSLGLQTPSGGWFFLVSGFHQICPARQMDRLGFCTRTSRTDSPEPDWYRPPLMYLAIVHQCNRCHSPSQTLRHIVLSEQD